MPFKDLRDDMENWKNEKLFDDRPYKKHKYLAPNVIEVHPIKVENTGHDETFDHLKCQIIEFPQHEDIPDLAA
jgi:hypothetical protein